MDRKRIIGFIAGITAGVSYGMNPLFAHPLMECGVSVETMLLFRYAIAAAVMGIWMLASGQKLGFSWRESPWLLLEGLLFCSSSITLFESYKFIPAGLATTMVYLYPIFVAVTMAMLGTKLPWQVWLSVGVTFIGVFILCRPSGEISLNPIGLLISALSALVYAMFLVIVNSSRTVHAINGNRLTFWCLIVGTLIFVGWNSLTGIHGDLSDFGVWINLIGLAIFPTMISLFTLTASTRLIGPTRTSVLGVFEPVTAILIGSLFFGETMTSNIIIGIAICLSAITFMVASDVKT